MCVCGCTESRCFLEPNGRRGEARDVPFEDPGLASDENGTVNGDYDWYASLGDSRLVISMCGEEYRGGAGNGGERRPRREMRGTGGEGLGMAAEEDYWSPPQSYGLLLSNVGVSPGVVFVASSSSSPQ